MSSLSRDGGVCESSVKSEYISSVFRDVQTRVFHGAHER